MLRSIKHYFMIVYASEISALLPALHRRDDSYLTEQALSEMSKAISKASTTLHLKLIRERASSAYADFTQECSTKAGNYLLAWIFLHTSLENPDAGTACECPYVYFFVKFCLDQGSGVPKLALALYDKMNMQLSREFIRCANPACELNRLDKSTGQVKFQKCSRCRAVIYCSRECQVAHYPHHKRLCREHSTDQKGS